MARVARGGGVSEAHSVWFRRSTMKWGRWDGKGRLLQHIVQGEANRIEGHDAAQRDPHPPAPPEHPYHTVSAAVLRRGSYGGACRVHASLPFGRSSSNSPRGR